MIGQYLSLNALVRATAIICAAIGTLAACGKNSNPDVLLNPAPKRSYDATIYVTGAPGTFDSVTAQAFYQVDNASCAPTDIMSGTVNAPHAARPLKIFHDPDGSYQTSFLLDPFLDKDYFGRGVCHWAFTSLSIIATKAGVSYLATYSSRDLASSIEGKNYFAKGTFGHSSKPLRIAGIANPAIFGANAATFTINITAKEAKHDRAHK